MRWTWWTMMALVALALGDRPALADDIYTWRDAGGQVHFSNVPSTEQRGATLGTADTVPPDELHDADAASELSDEQQKFADGAALQRSRIARDLRDVDRQIKDVDARLAELARARTAHAAGLPSTGGLGTNAAAYRSPEELALEAERGALQKRRDETAAGAQKLRAEVDEKLGGTPSWWIDP